VPVVRSSLQISRPKEVWTFAHPEFAALIPTSGRQVTLPAVAQVSALSGPVAADCLRAEMRDA